MPRPAHPPAGSSRPSPLIAHRSWRQARAVPIGAPLAPGWRTVASVPRAGRSRERRVVSPHRAPSRAARGPRAGGRILPGPLAHAHGTERSFSRAEDVWFIAVARSEDGTGIRVRGIHRDPRAFAQHECSATTTLTGVLPHGGMFPNGLCLPHQRCSRAAGCGMAATEGPSTSACEGGPRRARCSCPGPADATTAGGRRAARRARSCGRARGPRRSSTGSSPGDGALRRLEARLPRGVGRVRRR